MNIRIFFYLFALIPITTLGQKITPQIKEEISRRTELKINPNISIGVLLPTGEEKYYNFGDLNKSGIRPDSLSLYEIGSVTKTFTYLLAEKNLNDLRETPVLNFFPDIQNNELKGVTINEVGNHISGLPRLTKQFSPDDWSDPFNGYSDDKLIRELQNVSIDSSKRWNYSNFGYGVLGLIIERETNKSFEKLMKGLIQDIGMSNTYLKHSTPNDPKMMTPTNIGIENKFWHFTGPSRYAGGIISCTSDLIRYLKYQKNNNPLFKSDNEFQPIQTGIDDLGEGQLFYKNGWFNLQPDEETEILIHNGGTGGFTSFVAFNKKTEMGIVILSNSVSLIDDIGLKIIYPDFKLNRPERTIAYEIAENIEDGNSENIVEDYNKLKAEGFPSNILNIYWLERFNFGNKNFKISNQLSDIMISELPDDWEVWDIKGQNYESLEMFAEAEKAYQKAFTLNPGNTTLTEKIQRCKNSQG